MNKKAKTPKIVFYVRKTEQGFLPGALLAGPFNDEQTARQHQQKRHKSAVFREALI